MIVNHWPAEFLSKAGGFPSCYCAFDLETTGFDRKTDVIIEIGHVLVVDGEVVDELSILLDWTKHDVVPEHWLIDRIAYLRQKFSKKGIAHHLPFERLKAEGIHPIEALEFYRNYFTKLKSQGTPVVGHNVYRFDEPFLEACLVGFGVTDEFEFGDWQLWDTLCLEAATQAGPNPKTVPQPGDTLRSWMERVTHIRAETNLTRTLLKKYDLTGRYSIDAKLSHSACYDARLCHYLMQTYREMLKDVAEPATVKVAPVPVPKRVPGRVPGDQPALFDAGPPAANAVHGDSSRRRKQRNR